MKFVLLALVTILSSCSLVRQSALNVTAELVEQGSYEVETDKNYDLVRRALPGNLKFLEGLYYVDPANKSILLALLKGYAGQAFAFDETNLLEEQLKGIEEGPAYHQTVLNYSKAIQYGIEYLQQSGIAFKQLSEALKQEKGVSTFLNKELDTDSTQDFEVVFYLAQSIGSLINIKKTDLALVSQLSLVKSLFDWSCQLKPNYAYGACDIFYASYEASRPPMLGGSPQKGKELFEKAMKRWKGNALVTINYIQRYVIPMIEEDEFEKMEKNIEKIQKNVVYVWRPNDSFEGKKESDTHLNLYNEIAFKRLTIIKKFKKDIF